MFKPKKTTAKSLKLMDAKHTDIINKVPDPVESDIIIPIMGPTGVGKSTFINTAAGREVAPVGHDLQSCTAIIQPVIVPYPGDATRRVVFVDTPGFDDTWIDDVEILRRIAVWLALSYHDGMKVSGLIYLHEISQNRMHGTSRLNLIMFNKLCGDEAVKHVILATTKWSHIVEDVGLRREQQLRETHWKTMLDKGSYMARFVDTQDSAFNIVDFILKNNGHDALRIQQELVDLHKRIPTTDAGISLRNSLQALVKDQRERVHQLKKEAQENVELKGRYEEAQKQLRSTLDQIQELTGPFEKRFLAAFFPRQ